MVWRLDGKEQDGQDLWSQSATAPLKVVHSPSLKSFAEQLSMTMGMFSRMTMRPASLPMSRSGPGPLAPEEFPDRKTSLSLGITLSVNARFPVGIALTILKTFCKMSESSSRSFISSSSAGRTFFSSTDLGNCGSIRARPRINWAFSFGVFAGNESRKRIVETRMLSKYCDCWNSRAERRCAGRRVMRRGSTAEDRASGNGREERNWLLGVGVVDGEVKSFL